MPYTSQHTRDVPILSYEYNRDLITGFPFVLVFTCTFCHILVKFEHILRHFIQDTQSTCTNHVICVYNQYSPGNHKMHDLLMIHQFLKLLFNYTLTVAD